VRGKKHSEAENPEEKGGNRKPFFGGGGSEAGEGKGEK